MYSSTFHQILPVFVPVRVPVLKQIKPADLTIKLHGEIHVK